MKKKTATIMKMKDAEGTERKMAYLTGEFVIVAKVWWPCVVLLP